MKVDDWTCWLDQLRLIVIKLLDKEIGHHMQNTQIKWWKSFEHA